MDNSKTNPAAAAFIADTARIAAAKVEKLKGWGCTLENSGALRDWTRILEAAKKYEKNI